MTFQKKKLEEVNCPRCNAKASIRVEEESEGGTVLLYLICDKCKLRKYTGTTNRSVLRLRETKQKLYAKLEKTTNEPDRLKILQTVQTLEDLIVQKEIGL